VRRSRGKSRALNRADTARQMAKSRAPRHVHHPDEIAYLESIRARTRRALVGQEQEFLCLTCGRRIWADAVAAFDGAPPEHCGYEMADLPPMRPKS
jgi:hypothetical protein